MLILCKNWNDGPAFRLRVEPGHVLCRMDHSRFCCLCAGARTRASIAVSAFDHAHPFSRGAPRDAAASGPSSCSLLGPLNLHMLRKESHLDHLQLRPDHSLTSSSSSCSHALPSAPPAHASFGSSCIEEDEQEHDTCSQPSMSMNSPAVVGLTCNSPVQVCERTSLNVSAATESSGSSSRCLSGSTGSDSGCVSSHLQEALQEEPQQPPSSGRKSDFLSAVSYTCSDWSELGDVIIDAVVT